MDYSQRIDERPTQQWMPLEPPVEHQMTVLALSHLPRCDIAAVKEELKGKFDPKKKMLLQIKNFGRNNAPIPTISQVSFRCLEEKPLKRKAEAEPDHLVKRYCRQSCERLNFSGYVYEGAIDDKGMRCGLGKEILSYGITFEGKFIDDQYQGEGTLQFPFGYEIKGFFSHLNESEPSSLQGYIKASIGYFSPSENLTNYKCSIFNGMLIKNGRTECVFPSAYFLSRKGSAPKLLLFGTWK